ncbi:hypothetical protein BST81_05680 [Leptolyngbya sp. 'hensonii']|uniref:hypothetical protein n=1 Tax=Leptolyngbya sp. 'hensonii' TaxID=1922337 RepID=UPI00094F51A0|nr:hypothetical protein [Leptolyngbya sp. 'hensonii']OLP19251.1 hypothetical protein BST81_05680 [Leptolyngbya sp. 'hensonii']
MQPVFRDTIAWQQAEVLMQPAFIRVIDNIRKQLDLSTWKGTYQTVEVWPPGTTEEIKAAVAELRQRLDSATPEQTEEIQEILVRLPAPHPGYELCLEQQGHRWVVDLWDLCYQVCFRNYVPGQSAPVEIDHTLMDETGQVDWQILDDKTKSLVEAIFAKLPG